MDNPLKEHAFQDHQEKEIAEEDLQKYFINWRHIQNEYLK